MIDLNAWNSAVFERLHTDAGGAAIRAKVGVGSVAPADSIIRAQDLDKPLPARPFLALSRGVVGGQSMDMRQIKYTWWIYDDPGQGYWRIGELAKLIETAYDRLWILHAETTTEIRDERPDDALAKLASSVLVTLHTRG